MPDFPEVISEEGGVIGGTNGAGGFGEYTQGDGVAAAVKGLEQKLWVFPHVGITAQDGDHVVNTNWKGESDTRDGERGKVDWLR